MLSGRLDGFSEPLPISETRRFELAQELSEEDRPAQKAFDRGIVASVALAGAIELKTDEKTGEHLPFVMGTDPEARELKWFKQALFLLAPVVVTEIHADTLAEMPDRKTGFAFNPATGLWLTAVSANRDSVPTHHTDLPDNIRDVYSFQILNELEIISKGIITMSDTKLRPIAVVRA